MNSLGRGGQFDGICRAVRAVFLRDCIFYGIGNRESVMQNLEDAGCKNEMIQEFAQIMR